MKKFRIAIFASGRGSNASEILNYFKDHPTIEVVMVLTNNTDAGVVRIAQKQNVPTEIITNLEASNADFMIHLCMKWRIDFIILAGYLRLIPEQMAKAFHRRIINIHPSLLPKFGGKGMYGDFVHNKVLETGEKISGITIHFVDTIYDHGEMILQKTCNVTDKDTLETLKKKVTELEHAYFAPTIEQTILATMKS